MSSVPGEMVEQHMLVDGEGATVTLLDMCDSQVSDTLSSHCKKNCKNV